MECFWDTVDTIGEGFGFSLFGARHLVTLALYIAFAALSCKRYKAADEKKRAQLRKLFAVLLLADEAFKQIGLQIGGNFNWDYLPLHLCSINIFLIALYAWKPSRLLDNFLYFICIPAATAALLFPTWTSLPAVNFMFWHSTSVHILLAAYPIMLFSGGEIRPSVRYMGQVFLAAVGDGGADLLRQPAARYKLYVPDVRAGRQPTCVVPRPFRLSLDRLPRAARGGVRADGCAGSAQGTTGKQGDPCGGIKIKKKRFFHVEEPLFCAFFLTGGGLSDRVKSNWRTGARCMVCRA